jgi:predicted PurR-regulated permease PerM
MRLSALEIKGLLQYLLGRHSSGSLAAQYRFDSGMRPWTWCPFGHSEALRALPDPAEEKVLDRNFGVYAIAVRGGTCNATPAIIYRSCETLFRQAPRGSRTTKGYLMTKPDSADKQTTEFRAGIMQMSPPQRNASLVAALLLFLAGLFTLKEFIPALVWAMVFAIALWPLFQRAAARWPRHRHELIPVAFVVAIVLIFVIPVVVIAIPLASDAHDMFDWIHQVEANGMPAPAALANLPEGAKLTALWQSHLSQPSDISALAHGAMKGGAAHVASTIGRETVHRLILLGFTLLALYFFLRDADAVVEQLQAGSRRAFGPAGEDVGRQIIRSVQGTVNGLVFVALGEGVILGIAYLIAGVPHPTLFGLLTAILAVLPFGASVGFGVAALVLLAGGHTAAAIVIVVIGAVVAFIADHFIRPVLIGGAIRLPFIWVLLGILGGFSAFGLVGLFVGPAIMAALILLWREWVGAEPGPINPAHGEEVG